MMQLSEIHDPAATQAAADRSSSLNSSGVRVSTTSGKRSRPSSTASSKKSSALGSSRGGSGGDGDARSATSNRASFFGRMSSFGASGGPGSTLRDTFFGKARSDPLEDSSQNEFNLTVIDEEGLIEKPSAQIIAPRLGGCCGEKWSTAGYIVVGIAVLALVTTYIATLLSPTLNGYDIDPGLVLGSLQTLFLCAIVVITYNCVQVFQAHPNPIIMYKCVIDMVLAMRFLLDPWLLEAGVYTKGDRSSCAQLSGFTQFLYFSSDCMYFALIVDLYKSLTNPFTSVQGDRKKYMVSVCLAGMASGLLTALVKDFHGFADGNYCWTHRGDSTERNFWKLNVASWTVFYDWMIVFYLSGIGVLIYGMRRLRSGLKVTLDSRLEMLRHSAISIMSFTGYWTIAFSWYAISFSARTHYEKNGQMSPSKVFRTYSYTLAGRGVVDYFVWFMINKPSRMKANWMQFTSESADKKFSAQLNTALQRELIFFTIEGMTKAVQIADEELLRSRERSPTQELVLGHDDEEKEEERGSVASFQTPSTAPVMNLSYAGSEAERASIDSSSTTASKKAKKSAGQHEAPDRRSFLSTMGFSRGTSSNLGVPPGSVHKSPFVEPPPPPSSYTSEQHIKFTPYRSETFAELRSACGIKTDDFLRSFESSTKPSISEGASGAFMFFSGDKKFIVKSMAESECRFLCDIADDYVDYLIENPWSLITKFYGCFKITLYEKKFYFVVMENLFDVMEEGVTIHHRYDIKGSWVNRSYSRPRRGAKLKCRHCSMQFKYGASKSSLQCPNVVGLHEPNVVLKDNDLRTRMRIGSEAGKHLYECLREDSLFLCSLGIMDYSLLLGVTDIEFMVDPPSPKDNGPHERRNTVTSRVSVSVPDKLPTRSERTGSGNQTSVSTLASSEDASFTSLGGIAHNASHLESVSTARATATYSARSVESFHSSRSQNVSHRTASDPAPPPSVVMVAPREKNSMRKSERVFGPGFYYIGIIDILQTWTLQKRMERFWKVHVRRCDPNGLSAIDPVRYQRRFEAKLREIIAIPKDMRGSLASPSGLTTRQSLGIGSDAGRGSIGKRPVRGVSREDSVLARLRMHAAVQEEDDDEDVVDLEQGVARNPEQILMRVTSSQRRATGSSGAPLVSGSAIQAV